MTLRLLALIGTTLLGGAIPLWLGSSHKLLHRFVALTTGLFLGIVFMHLLPDALGAGHGAARLTGDADRPKVVVPEQDRLDQVAVV